MTCGPHPKIPSGKEMSVYGAEQGADDNSD